MLERGIHVNFIYWLSPSYRRRPRENWELSCERNSELRTMWRILTSFFQWLRRNGRYHLTAGALPQIATSLRFARQGDEPCALPLGACALAGLNQQARGRPQDPSSAHVRRVVPEYRVGGQRNSVKQVRSVSAKPGAIPPQERVWPSPFDPFFRRDV